MKITLNGSKAFNKVSGLKIAVNFNAGDTCKIIEKTKYKSLGFHKQLALNIISLTIRD